MRTHQADAPKRDRIDTGMDNVYWCPSYGMYLAKHGAKRHKTKDFDAATHFARSGSKLGDDQQDPDNPADDAIDENSDGSLDNELEIDGRAVSPDDHEDDEHESDDRDVNPDDREGDGDDKNDVRDQDDDVDTPKFRFFQLLKKNAK